MTRLAAALALTLFACSTELDADRDDVITFVESESPCLVTLPGEGLEHCEGGHCLIWPVCAACEDPVDGGCDTWYGPTECLTEEDCPPPPENW